MRNLFGYLKRKLNNDRSLGKCVVSLVLAIAMLLPLFPSAVFAESYETEEGCLSLSGVRSVKRYKKITVEYLDADFKPRRDTFTDHVAQIIQHEYDHTRGIVI